MIDQVTFVDPHPVPSKQLQQVLGVVAAMADPPAPEDLATIEVEAVEPIEIRLLADEQADDLFLQLGSDALVDVQGHHPCMLEREVVQSPEPLTRMRLEVVLGDVGSMALRDRMGAISAPRVNHEHLANPLSETRQARVEVRLLVVGEDDRGDGRATGHRRTPISRTADRPIISWYMPTTAAV